MQDGLATTFDLLFPVGQPGEEVSDPLLHRRLGPQAQVSRGLCSHPAPDRLISVEVRTVARQVHQAQFQAGCPQVLPHRLDDEASGMLITAVDVVDDPTDYGQFTPMLEQAEETTGTKACMTLADAGYYSGSNLSECAGRGQGVAMPETSQRQSRGHPYHKDRFAYDESSDSFRCPQGKALPFERIHISSKGAHFRFYRAPGAVCRACPAFGMCTKSKNGRNVSVGPYDAALRRHRAWMATSAAKEVYKLRKQLVEPVFGIIKEQRAGRRFLLRGLANVAAEWTVLATAFNLRTLWRVWRSRGFGHVFGGHHVPHRGPQSLIALPESCR